VSQSSGHPPPGGQFRSTRRREIAELPDTVQRGHALHFSALDANTKASLQGWSFRLSQIMAPVAQAQSEQEKEYAWSQIDKDKIRSLLNEMNHWDRSYSQSTGNRLSDFVNANGLIPRFLAERLDSGSRFFDPEKIRGKLSEENRISPKFSDNEESIFSQFRKSDRHQQSKMLQDPSIRSIVERKMGLNPSSQSSQASPGDVGPSSDEHQESQENTQNNVVGDVGPLSDEGAQSIESSDQRKGSRRKKFDLDPRLKKKVKIAAEKWIGDDNPEAQEALEGVIPDAWRSIKNDVNEWNEGLRGIFGAVSKGRGNSLNSMALKVSRAEDPMSIVGFDEYVDFARKYYPHIVANKWGEEEGLMEAFRIGLKKEPAIDSDEVVNRAVDMLGPGFRRMLEEGIPQDLSSVHSEPIYEPGDPLPFSVRAWMSWMNRNNLSFN
jgi:hypothetical protein